MNWFGVALLYPMLETSYYRVDLADEYDSPPDQGAAAPGVLLRAGVAELGPMELVVGAGTRVTAVGWGATAGEVRMTMWEPGLDLAARWETPGERARAYAGFGLGPRVSVLRRSWGTPLSVVTGEMYANFGVNVGPPRGHAFVEARLSTTPRGDRFYGYGAAGTDTFYWQWDPGRVGMVALAGGSFGVSPR